MKFVMPIALLLSFIGPSVAGEQRDTLVHTQLKASVEKELGKDKSGDLRPFFGDHNDDGIEDALVFAYYAQEDHGKMVFLDVLLFEGTQTGFKYVKSIPDIYGQDPRAAKFGNGTIEITLTTLEPNDSRCCPSGTKAYTISTR